MTNPQTSRVENLLNLAESLAQWIEKALIAVRENPRAFDDLEFPGLNLGQVLLRQKLIPEARSFLMLPMTVVICGGTNTGKSTVLNSIAGRSISPAGSTASFTKRIIAAGNSPVVKKIAESHPGFQLFPTAELKNSASRRHGIYGDEISDWPGDLPILFDTPDIDSSDIKCRESANFALGLADIVVWVTTQQKYKDLAGIRFLDNAMDLIRNRIDVFNQALPRHAEALEDLLKFYGERWPDNERCVVTIEEQAAMTHGLLSEHSVESLKSRLKSMNSNKRKIKAVSIAHALEKVGSKMTDDGKKLARRRDEFMELSEQIENRFEKKLFSPLLALSGHEAPFELQAALIRVLGPRIQTPIGDILGQLHRSAGQAISWVFNKITWGALSSSNASLSDPVFERDRQDLEEASRIIDAAKLDLYERSRKRSSGGNSVYIRFHSDLKKLEFPTADELPELLRRHLENGNKEFLAPIVKKFETELEGFCDRNPMLINTIKAVVPGFSALAALAATAFSIHTFALLPGATEFILGGIALPIYKRFEEVLPHNLLTFADRISQEPIIRRSRQDFAKMRRALFIETAGWLAKPVKNLFPQITLKEIDIAREISRIQDDWREVFGDLLE